MHVMPLSITPKDYGLCFTLLPNILRHVLFVDFNDFSCSNRLLFRADNDRCCQTLPESPGSYQTAGNFNTCVEDCWTTNLLAKKKRFWFLLAWIKKRCLIFIYIFFRKNLSQRLIQQTKKIVERKNYSSVPLL